MRHSFSNNKTKVFLKKLVCVQRGNIAKLPTNITDKCGWLATELFRLFSKYCCNLSGGVGLIVWFTTNGMCAKNKNIYAWREQAIIRDCDAWSLLLLAVTVRSFAHMPLGISDRNSTHLPTYCQELSLMCKYHKITKIAKTRTLRSQRLRRSSRTLKSLRLRS